MTNNLNVNIMIAVDLEVKTKKKEVKRKANNFKKICWIRLFPFLSTKIKEEEILCFSVKVVD